MLAELLLGLALLSNPAPKGEAAPPCQIQVKFKHMKLAGFTSDCKYFTISIRGQWVVFADKDSTFLFRVPNDITEGKLIYVAGDYMAQVGGVWVEVKLVQTKYI